MKNNWPIKKLRDVADILMGQSPPSSTYNLKDEGLPFFQGKAEFGDLYPAINKYCSKPVRVAEAGDILLSVRAPVGPINIAKEKICIGRGLSAIRAKNGLTDQWYLYYLLKQKENNWDGSTGSTFQAINRQTIENLLISSPAIGVQKKIVERLNAIRKAQELCDQQIQKTEELFESILHNEVTKSGKETLFTEVTDFQEGPGILAKDFRSSGIPLVRLKGTTGSKVTLEGCNFLDPLMVKKKWNHFILKKGDLLLTTSASLGQVSEVADVAEGSITYTGIIRFRPDTNILDRGYLKYFLSSELFKLQAKNAATGGVIKHFGPIHLKKMKIFLPSLVKQKIIVEKLEAVENYKRLLQKQKILFKELFDSVLDKSMKGEI